MEHKSFINSLTKALDRNRHDVTALIDALAIVIRDNCAELDAVAIPGFGSFVPQKHDEAIITDQETGRRIMTPPQITLSFNAGSRLKKLAGNE